MANINNFIVDHVLRGIMFDSEGNYLWSINQIQNPSLSVTSETAEKTDALGTPIAVFNRGKSGEFSGENAVFDLGLFAAQNGRDKEIAATGSPIPTPSFETCKYDGATATYALKHTPIEPPNVIFLLNGDGTLGTAYKKAASASATEFAYSSGTISLPTGLTTGDEIFIVYDYNSTSAAAVTGTAVDFPKTGRFIMETIGADACNSDIQIHAFIEFPKAKLDANVEVSFQTDSTHPFTIQCQQDYCDRQKTLYRIIIPDEE